MNLPTIPVYCWTAAISVVSLSWTREHPSRWETFAADICRVSGI